MTLLDWRELPGPVVAALLDAERRWWLAHLDWDLTTALAAIEPARQARRLPGLVVVDEGRRPVAWAFFTGEGDQVQVGALDATDVRAGRLLASALVEAADAVGAAVITGLIRPGVAGVAERLAELGFALEPYGYFEVSTRDSRSFAREVRLFTTADRAGVADLLARAYAGSTEGRPFAPRGTEMEWVRYTTQILESPGCGLFQARASVVTGSRRLEGAALITAIGETTAHLAQVAVDPAARRHGLGRQLVESAAAAARARGFTRLTLFVAAANARALGLYEQLGFRPTASFLAAVRSQPRVLKSVAEAAAGASTRR
jgi:ribosomal protein S18 acetylase RimI-like enzyme